MERKERSFAEEFMVRVHCVQLFCGISLGKVPDGSRILNIRQ